MKKLWVIFLLGTALSSGVGRAETTTATVAGQEPGTVLTGGLGLIFYSNRYTQLYNSGSVGRSISASLLGRMGKSSWYWGLDFALNFWSFNSEFQAPSIEVTRGAVGIQPLLTIQYRFAPLGPTSIYPYFGFSAGPQLYIQRNTFTNASTLNATSNTETTLYLELLARPGVELRFASWFALLAEPKFGLLGTDFILQPMLSAALML